MSKDNHLNFRNLVYRLPLPFRGGARVRTYVDPFIGDLGLILQSRNLENHNSYEDARPQVLKIIYVELELEV